VLKKELLTAKQSRELHGLAIKTAAVHSSRKQPNLFSTARLMARQQ